MSAQPDISLATIGACIYCPRTDSLSDEHIVPAGLDGNAVRRDASCPDCARITSAFESRVLDNIRDIRAGLGLGSKRRKTKLLAGFDAMMEMRKIDIAAIEVARRG